jgi:hypothetical protein
LASLKLAKPTSSLLSWLSPLARLVDSPPLFRLERRTWLSFSLGFAMVGLVLTLRRPASPIGWL